MRLGCATETYDASERQAAGIAPPPAPEISRGARWSGRSTEFRGTYLQAPPRYSAKKIGGVAAHRLARRASRRATRAGLRHRVRARARGLADGLVRLSVTASAGFYVRTLAHDLGERLGCGAHLEALRRTRAAGFTLDSAVALDVIECGEVEVEQSG